MKFTKRQLRRIIKEERAKLMIEKQNTLNEKQHRHPKTGEDLFLMLNDVVDKLMDSGIDFNELANELRGLADDVENSTPDADPKFFDMTDPREL